MRAVLVKISKAVERLVEQLGRKSSPPVIDPYCGYETPDGLVLRARVLTHLRRSTPEPGQSRWVNFRQMLSLFITDEVEGVRVRAAGQEGVSDAEGYVTLEVPAAEGTGQWRSVEMEIVGSDAAPVSVPVRVPGPEATRMVISDIDDTMIETGAHSLTRNLWTTFTGSTLTREAHDDAIALVNALSDGERNPVFYVSSSPWNLHAFLTAVFARESVPEGPKFLRDLGVSSSGGIGESHKDHKSVAIETILEAQPDLPAILLGDTGQKDAPIYAAIVEKYPGRILGVGLREPSEDVPQEVFDAVARIRAAGVPCHHGPLFDGALEAFDLPGDAVAAAE